MDVVVLVVLFALLLAVVGVMVLGVVYLIGTAVGSREESVVLEYELPAGSTGGVRQVVDEVSPLMQSARYQLTWLEETVACFERRYRPVWRIVLAILLLPLGLLLLFWVKTDSLLFQVLPGSQNPRLVVNGKLGHSAHDQLRDLLVKLGTQHAPAGWYPDKSGTERYWDGENWTDQTRGERIVVGPRMTGIPPS
jgi:hypothetical protein